MKLKFSISFEQTPLDHKNKYRVNLEEIMILNLVAKDEFFSTEPVYLYYSLLCNFL